MTVMLSRAGGLLLPVIPGPSYDYYISPTGSDANAGTQLSPWAITAINTKQATYAGKRVGLADGTYSVYALIQAGSGDGYTPALNIQGGTAGSPTVIQAINARMAVLECANGGVTIPTVNTPVIGQASTSVMGYVTIDGLKIQHGGSKVIELGGSAGLSFPSQFPGWTVQNCEMTGQVTAGFADGNNFSTVELIGGISPIILNNFLHDNKGHFADKSADHFSGVIQWFTSGATIRQNVLENAAHIHAKESGNQGSTIRFNYVDLTGWTSAPGIMDYSGATTVGLTQTTSIDHNIIIASQPCDLEAELGNGGWRTNLLIFNNTFIADPTTGFNNATLRAMGQASVTRFAQIYNNIFYNNGHAATSYGNITLSISAAALIDYNLYGTALFYTVPDGTYTSAGGTSRVSLAAWQAAMAGATGAEAHSVIGAATFSNIGARALQYNVVSGLAFNTGTVGGVVSGLATNLGAMDGSGIPGTSY